MNSKPNNTPFVGLYYPFIHFRDEEWLKAASLFWDKLIRILPSRDTRGQTFEPDDSPEIKRLADADFIGNISVEAEGWPVDNELHECPVERRIVF